MGQQVEPCRVLIRSSVECSSDTLQAKPAGRGRSGTIEAEPDGTEGRGTRTGHRDHGLDALVGGNDYRNVSRPMMPPHQSDRVTSPMVRTVRVVAPSDPGLDKTLYYRPHESPRPATDLRGFADPVRRLPSARKWKRRCTQIRRDEHKDWLNRHWPARPSCGPCSAPSAFIPLDLRASALPLPVG
jgi:hypothetical protein